MYNILCTVIFLRHCPPPHTPERVCVYVCAGERERERDLKGERDRRKVKQIHSGIGAYYFQHPPVALAAVPPSRAEEYTRRTRILLYFYNKYDILLCSGCTIPRTFSIFIVIVIVAVQSVVVVVVCYKSHSNFTLQNWGRGVISS